MPGPYVLAPAPSGGDDYATIQALITANNPLNVPVVLRQGEYLTSTEISPATGFPLRLYGSGHVYATSNGTSIKLIGDPPPALPKRSVVALTEAYSVVRGMRLDANRLGLYGVYVANGVAGHLIDGACTNALLDGIHVSATGLNQAIETFYWFSYENGKLYATAAIHDQYAGTGSALVRRAAIAGKATTVAGNDTITIVDGPDLTSADFGIRAGDIVRVGGVAATAYFGQIASVTATTIVVQPLLDNRPTISAADQDYAIGIGFGWYEEIAGGNGFCYLKESWFRGNGAMGVFNNSLYGDKIVDCLIDFNCSGGIALGFCYNLGSLREPYVQGVYTEGCVGPDYLLGNVLDGHIINPGGGNAIFSVCGSQAQIAIHRHGRVESAQLGARQNFLLEFRNDPGNPGTIQHRIVAERWIGFASIEADKIINASVAWTNTPTVSNVVGFATGVGIYDAGGVLEAILQVGVAQNAAIGGSVQIEFNNTGTNYLASITITSMNVNGVTLLRPTIFLTDTSGAVVSIPTALAAAGGKSIGFRY